MKHWLVALLLLVPVLTLAGPAGVNTVSTLDQELSEIVRRAVTPD
jgi:hypothetical protein